MKGMPKKVKDRAVVAESIMTFHSGNGIVDSDKALPHYSPVMGSVRPRLLEDSPDVYSVGYRCIEEGWEMRWPAWSHHPYFKRPDGMFVVLVADEYIPYVVEDPKYVVAT